MKRIKVSNIAGLLATIVHTLGFIPVESFVLLTMRGNTLGVTLRVNIPAQAPTGHFTDYMVDHLRHHAEADGALMVIYTDTAGVQPHSENVHALEMGMMTAGMPIKEIVLVTSAGFRDYTKTAEALTPLTAITTSAANAELIFAGSDTESGKVQEREFTGAADNAATITGLVKGFPEVDPLDISAPVMRRVRSIWSEALGTVPDADTACLLVAFVQNVGLRDRLMADLFNTEEAEFENVLLGQLTTRPTWKRVEQGQALTLELLAQTPQEFRAPLYMMLGFISWYQGRGSVANQYMDKALKVTPGYRLATLFKELIAIGYIAPVNLDKKLAYPGEE